MWPNLSGLLLASCFLAPLFIDALLRATSGIGKLIKLPLQQMTSGLDCGHVLNELPYLSRQRVIFCHSRAL
jgi:hypothetical protein